MSERILQMTQIVQLMQNILTAVVIGILVLCIISYIAPAIFGEKAQIFKKIVNVIIKVLAVIVLVIGFMFFSNFTYVYPSTSTLVEVNEPKAKIEVIGYYKTNYKAIDKQVLTLIVKNNTDKIIVDGEIREENTESSIKFEYLYPQEEKFIPIVINKNYDGKYKFKVNILKKLEG